MLMEGGVVIAPVTAQHEDRAVYSPTRFKDGADRLTGQKTLQFPPAGLFLLEIVIRKASRQFFQRRISVGHDEAGFSRTGHDDPVGQGTAQVFQFGQGFSSQHQRASFKPPLRGWAPGGRIGDEGNVSGRNHLGCESLQGPAPAELPALQPGVIKAPILEPFPDPVGRFPVDHGAGQSRPEDIDHLIVEFHHL